MTKWSFSGLGVRCSKMSTSASTVTSMPISSRTSRWRARRMGSPRPTLPPGMTHWSKNGGKWCGKWAHLSTTPCWRAGESGSGSRASSTWARALVRPSAEPPISSWSRRRIIACKSSTEVVAMQSLRMRTESLPAFMEGLKAWGAVWPPVEKEPGVFALEAIDDVSRARPDALRTILPFKKLLTKPRFTMVEREGDAPPRESHDNERGPMVFFGAHACDVNALKLLDMLYLSDYPDTYYRRNREALTVVGHGCWPDGKCFCESLGTSQVDDVFDLFLHPLDGRYLVTVRTTRGDDIVRAMAANILPP